MKYTTVYKKKFNKSFKKLNTKDQVLVKQTIWALAMGKRLDATYKNHRLKGNLNGRYDCHVRGGLVLTYEKNEKELILSAIDVGNHSNIF